MSLFARHRKAARFAHAISGTPAPAVPTAQEYGLELRRILASGLVPDDCVAAITDPAAREALHVFVAAFQKLKTALAEFDVRQLEESTARITRESIAFAAARGAAEGAATAAYLQRQNSPAVRDTAHV